MTQAISSSRSLFDLLEKRIDDEVDKNRFRASVAVNVQQQEVRDTLLADLVPPSAHLLDIKV